MNSNVEIINDDLFAVNMAYINAGYIQELQPLKGTDEHITLTNNGILIIDKASVLYPAMKRLLPEIMEKKTNEIREIMWRYSKTKMDALDDLIFNLYGWELKRRIVKADYVKKHPETIFERIRKKVMKWQVFRQAFN